MAGTRLNLWTPKEVSEQRRFEFQSKYEKLVQRLFDCWGIPRRQLDDFPALSHEVVEAFFRETYYKRHIKEGVCILKK